MPSIFLAKSNDANLTVYMTVKDLLSKWAQADPSNRSVLEWEKDKEHHLNTDYMVMIPPENGVNREAGTITVGRGLYEFIADRSGTGRSYKSILIVTSCHSGSNYRNACIHMMKSRNKIPGTSWQQYGEIKLKPNSFIPLNGIIDVPPNTCPSSEINIDFYWNVVAGEDWSLGLMSRSQIDELKIDLLSNPHQDEDEYDDWINWDAAGKKAANHVKTASFIDAAEKYLRDKMVLDASKGVLSGSYVTSPDGYGLPFRQQVGRGSRGYKPDEGVLDDFFDEVDEKPVCHRSIDRVRIRLEWFFKNQKIRILEPSQKKSLLLYD